MGAKTIPGIFAGYHQKVGGQWSGDLYVVSLADIKGNVNHKPHCKRIQAPNVYVNKKKGTEKDPNKGFLFPVKSIEEKYGESTHIPRDTSDSESESSSSSDSSDEELSGSRGKPLAADESESAEDIRAKRLEKTSWTKMKTQKISGWSPLTALCACALLLDITFSTLTSVLLLFLWNTWT